ncbi:hypothetical protein Anapl_11279 [Anas platyrhynchos]|uniref:Uncharacterized protein n=1 Tax=Anas platyrhynchos TaxID=8839 RepID=R0LLX5_ANAPL|nr:hypothetical protein Anapl_11279 [Anas platyrhynchos]
MGLQQESSESSKNVDTAFVGHSKTALLQQECAPEELEAVGARFLCAPASSSPLRGGSSVLWHSQQHKAVCPVQPDHLLPGIKDPSIFCWFESRAGPEVRQKVLINRQLALVTCKIVETLMEVSATPLGCAGNHVTVEGTLTQKL